MIYCDVITYIDKRRALENRACASTDGGSDFDSWPGRSLGVFLPVPWTPDTEEMLTGAMSVRELLLYYFY